MKASTGASSPAYRKGEKQMRASREEIPVAFEEGGVVSRQAHWGYVIRGRARVIYADREEVLEAGDAYYLEPGHNLVVEEDGEIVEFSPAGEYQKTMEAVAENMQAAQGV